MKNVGLVISVVAHAVVLGWGLFTLTAPMNFEQEETVYIPIEMTEFADTASARKGDETAPIAEKPAPKPVERPDENPNAENVGEGKLDTTQPYRPKEKDRQIETVTPNSGTPAAEAQVNPPPKPVVPPEPKETPPPPVAEPQQPEPQKPEPQPQENAVQETQTAVAEPEPQLPTNNAPVPNMKPREQQVASRPALRGESVEDILAREAPLINNQRTQGGASRGSNAPAAMGGDRNVGDNALRQTVANFIGGCIQRQTNIGALGGRSYYDLVVNIRMSVNPDGSIIGTPQLKATGGDADARDILTRQVNTAVFSCQPAFRQLPADKYNQWRDININVRPSSG